MDDKDKPAANMVEAYAKLQAAFQKFNDVLIQDAGPTLLAAAKAALEAKKDHIRWSKVGATSQEDYERILRGAPMTRGVEAVVSDYHIGWIPKPGLEPSLFIIDDPLNEGAEDDRD